MSFVIPFVLLSVCYIQQVRSYELQCRTKPGCHITRCDPSPLISVAAWLKDNEFPVACKYPDEEIPDVKILQEEVTSLKKELNKLSTSLSNLGIEELKSVPGKIHCIRPVDVMGGEIICTRKDYTPGTLCAVRCRKGRELTGANDIVCKEDGRWSQKFPTCTCSKCKTGKDCEVSISWLDTQASMKVYSHSWNSMKYGGKSFSCIYTAESRSSMKCSCKDKNTREMVTCRGEYHSGLDACDYAASKLIRDQVKRKLYLQPCDEEHMRPEC